MPGETYDDLLKRIADLEERLEQSEETLRALSSGEVDAVVASGPEGDRVYTLRGADEPYRLLVQEMAEGALTLTPEGLILFSNERFANLLGTTLERVIGTGFHDFLAPEDAEVFSRMLGASPNAGAKAEVRLKTSLGAAVPVYLAAKPLRFEGVDCIGLVVTDLTEQKRSAELLAAEQFARSILDQASEAVLVVDPDGRIVRASRGADRLAGVPVLQRSFDELFRLRAGPEDYPFDRIHSATARNQPIESVEVEARVQDRAVPALLSAAPLRDPDSRLLGAIVTLTDIGELKRVEATLRDSETRERGRVADLQAIMDAVPAAMFITNDREGLHVIGSQMTYSMLQVPPGSELSRSAPGGVGPIPMKNGHAIAPEELPVMVAARTGQKLLNCEIDLLYENGDLRQMLGNAVPLVDEGGLSRGAVGAFVDITERKLMEERLRETQKLESIGLLAGGIAHDFNNLLTGILGNTSLALEDLSASHSVAPYLQSALTACERAADLTRQLLAYAGKGRFVVERLDLSAVVCEITELIRSSVPKNVELSLELAEGLPAVAVDPAQIRQLIVNLVINGAEAIDKPGGRVLVRTSVQEVDSQYAVSVLPQFGVAEGTYIRLEVTDNGCGMDKNTAARIFDPFFSTKFTGRGLGLSAAQGIVRSHKGALKLYTEPEHGTTFVVLLPAIEAAVKKERIPRHVAARGNGTILVVDDEEVVRSLASATLKRSGYSVLPAENGAQALDIFAQNASRISLVLLDLTMPILDGVEAAERLKAAHPALKILLMSGYSEREAMRRFSRYQVNGFVQKPFTARGLAERVASVLKE